LENGVVVDNIFPYRSVPAISTGYEKLSELLINSVCGGYFIEYPEEPA
jgi:hypothetical protein